MIRHLMAFLFAVLLVLVSLVLIAIGTEPGMKALLHIVPGKVSYESFKGNLLATITVKNFHYQSPRFELSIDQGTLNAKPLLILKKQFIINSFKANHIDVLAHETKESPKISTDTKTHHWSPPKIDWILHHVSIEKLTVNYNQQDYIVQQVLINGEKTSDKLQIKDLEAEYNGTTFRANGHVSLSRPYGVKIKSELTTSDQQKSILTVDGDNTQWRLNITAPNIDRFEVSGSGPIISPKQASWDIQVKDLSEIISESSGSIQSSGHWQKKSFELTTTTEIKQLQWQQYAINYLHANIESNDKQEIEAEINAKDLDIPNHLIQNLTMNYQGNALKHSIKAKVSWYNGIDASVDANGSFKNNSWNGTLNQVSFTIPEYGTLANLNKPTLSISSNQVTLDQLCLGDHDGSSCIQGQWDPSGFSSKITLSKTPLALLNIWIKDRINPLGRVSGTINWQLLKGIWQYDISLLLDAGEIQYTIDQEQQSVFYDASTIKSSLDSNGLKIESQLKLKNQPTANINLALPNYHGHGLPDDSEKITGSVDLQSADLHALELISPVIDDVSGNLTFKGSLSGTIRKPIINATALVSKGKVTIVPLNIHANNVTIKANAKDSNQINIDLTARNNNNQLHAKGNIKIDGSHFPMTFQINGKNIKIMNTLRYQIAASPNVKVDIDGYHIDLSGKIDFPKARINPKDFSSTVNLPTDIVYVDINNIEIQQKTNPWKITSDLELSANKAQFAYQGLTATVSGSLTVVDNPNTPLSGNGSLIINEGSYVAYGQNLTIEPGGTLLFTGALSNPQLDLKATKKVSLDLTQSNIPTYERSMIVGVEATGQLKNPSITLYSNVSGLSDQDILSYLVFGFSSSQLSDSQTAMVWSAINALNSGAGGIAAIKQDLQENLGLSELGFASTTEYDPDSDQVETGTSFVIGKRINDRLSLSYSMGIQIPINILYLKYQLSRQWALQSDSSTLGNGADIIYTISRD